MSIHYEFIGHATHRFEMGDHAVLVDPFFKNNPATSIAPDSVTADFILITHGHFDHIEDAVAIARRTGATVISNFEIVGWFRSQGLPEEQVHPQHIGGGYSHPFGHVKLTIAHHGSGLPDGGYGGQPAGLLITAEDKRIYIAGDTALFSDMQLYKDPQVDLLILPIGDNFTMGPDDALQAVRWISPRHCVPCHYNTWPPIEQDVHAWADRVTSACPSTVVDVLGPGQGIDL